MKSRLILCGMALAAAGVSHAAFTPVAIQSSSYNADVIVEQSATPKLVLSTSASIDTGTNNTAATLFEVGFDTGNPANGLPVAGSTITAADDANHSFKMPPSYAAPNGILIDTKVTNGTFTLATPAAYSKLSFLCLGGNGGDVVGVTVHHQDGSTESAGTFGCPDWFGGSGVAIIMNGRLNTTFNLNTETDGTSGDGRGNPRVYYRDVTITNSASPITNIVLNYVSGSAGSHNDIIAVSGSTGGAFSPITVTGYTYDFVVEAAAPKNGRTLSQVMDNSTNLWATTQSLDNTNNTAASWYEQGFNINNNASGTYNNPADDFTWTGVPHPSALITNASGDHIYQMPADYTVNNATYISEAITNATITLATPANFSGLSFLGAAGNGPVPVQLTVHHQSGATEALNLSIADWFSSSAPVAYTPNGRVVVDNGQYQSVNSGFPRLIENDLVLGITNDPVTSIEIVNTNPASGRFALFAVSGAQGALPPIIVTHPTGLKVYKGGAIALTAAASANAPLTYQWQKGTNNVWVNVNNGGTVSGATTTTLNISSAAFADEADYRMIATDSAGSANSGAATVKVFSTDLDITTPGDPISLKNATAFGDGPPANSIDNEMSTKMGANTTGIPSVTTTPSQGLTILSALRIYTGNDASGRDPASFILEGSVNGGATYALIASNSLALPDARNSGLTSGTAPNPLTQNVQEVRFNNTNGYTTYRITYPSFKTAGGTQIQYQELELIGVTDTSKPYFSPQPIDAKAYNGGDPATFTAIPVFNPTPTVRWQKGNNGVYVPLTDGGNISGSTTPYLTITAPTFADVADYIAIATSTAGSVTSSVAHLYVFSTNTDFTVPTDTIVGFGDTTGSRYGGNTNAANLIDNTYTDYENGGSGDSAGAGFPPFKGPVGAVLTPSVGSTILKGLRIYPGPNPGGEDPADFLLEGSNDGGSTYSTIASGALSLPSTRNDVALAVDPISGYAQEILFSNSRSFTTYRLTFSTVVDPGNVALMSVGELEWLGVAGTSSQPPTLSKPVISGSNLTLAGTGGTAGGTFSVLTNASLSVPVSSWGVAATGTFDGSGNFSLSLPISTTTAHLFYTIQTP